MPTAQHTIPLPPSDLAGQSLRARVARSGARNRRSIVRSAAAGLVALALTAALVIPGLFFGLCLVSRLGDHPLIAITGGSMEPTIHLGDGVLLQRLEPAQAQRLSVGQIVTLDAAMLPGGSGSVSSAEGQRYVTHRIAAVVTTQAPAGKKTHTKAPSRGQRKTAGGSAPAAQVASISYRTKGDANTAEDPEIWPATAVVGRVVQRVPRAGYATAFYGSWLGRVSIAACAAGLLAMLALGAAPDQTPSDSRGTRATPTTGGRHRAPRRLP